MSLGGRDRLDEGRGTSVHRADDAFDGEEGLGVVGGDFEAAGDSFEVDGDGRAIGIFFEHAIYNYGESYYYLIFVEWARIGNHSLSDRKNFFFRSSMVRLWSSQIWVSWSLIFLWRSLKGRNWFRSGLL